MDYKKEFERMMETQSEIALATSVDGISDVRIVNFYYEPEKKRCTFPALQITKRFRKWSKTLM